MLLLSAFFSGSEIAFVSASRVRAEARAAAGGRVALLVREFLDKPEKFLITTLVGNNLALVLYSSLMAIELEGGIRSYWLDMIGGDVGVEVATITTQTIIATLIVLFVGEILPKSIARRTANHTIFLVAPLLRSFYYLLLPFNKISGWVSLGLLRLFGQEEEDIKRSFRREIEATIRESTSSGQIELDEQHGQLLSNVFRISRLRLKESMVPRTDIEGIEVTATIDALRDRFTATGFSKLPVYRDNIDNVVGVVFAYDLFRHPESLDEMVREVRFVPETKKSRDLLAEFLEENVSIAIVIDEYGGTAGMVTIEDLIEELTGEIQDEFDTSEFVARKMDDRTYVVSGRAEIGELGNDFGLYLPEGDYETVAGFLLEYLGYIPAAKEEFSIEGFRFSILRAYSHRIELVKITLK
jgi:CBS domain containing-hemolysin-like protein